MEISTLDKLYCWLELVEQKQTIMAEWYWLFQAKEHIEINKLKNKIKNQIRKELFKNGKQRY